MDADLKKAFLAELEALEKFRVSYTGMYPNVPLASEDPDIRRLLEALAFFTARTRVAADRNVNESVLRIFRQHFPYLLSPVPAMTMLRANTTRRYVDVSTLPRGSEVSLVRRGEGEEPDETYVFRTLATLRALPIELEGLETFRGPRGARLALRFAAAFPRNDEIGEIELYIDYLNDLHSSLLVLHELRSHLRATTIAWNHKIDISTGGEPCQIELGARPPASGEIDVFEHPLQRLRARLHFPQQDLFIRVRGMRTPRNWQRFTVMFDLDERFPASLRLNAECFRLHVVPIMNVRRETANPIVHDGTQERHLAGHPERSLNFVPVSVHAVYRKTEHGLEPLEPSMVGTTRASFEAQVEGRGQRRRAWISANLPDAFESPETLVAEAFWHQPLVSQVSPSDLEVRLAERFVDGIEWGLVGPLVAHADAELDDDREGMLSLLSIKGQRLLGLDEVQFLLRAFGVPRERPFTKFASAIAEVRIIDKPLARKGGGFKHIYEVIFNELTPSDMPRLGVFCARLLDMLAAWSIDCVLELVARVPNLEKELRFA